MSFNIRVSISSCATSGSPLVSHRSVIVLHCSGLSFGLESGLFPVVVQNETLVHDGMLSVRGERLSLAVHTCMLGKEYLSHDVQHIF